MSERSTSRSIALVVTVVLFMGASGHPDAWLGGAAAAPGEVVLASGNFDGPGCAEPEGWTAERSSDGSGWHLRPSPSGAGCSWYHGDDLAATYPPAQFTILTSPGGAGCFALPADAASARFTIRLAGELEAFTDFMNVDVRAACDAGEWITVSGVTGPHGALASTPAVYEELAFDVSDRIGAGPFQVRFLVGTDALNSACSEGAGTLCRGYDLDGFRLLATPSADTTPPTAPSGLAAVDPQTGGRIDLSWAAALDDRAVAGYRVYRSTAAGVQPSPGTLVAAPATTLFADLGLVDGTPYFYVVSAVDASGNEGPASNEAAATPTRDTLPPSKVSGLAAEPGLHRVTLSWLPVPDADVSSYRVSRGGALVGTTSATAFVEVGLPAGRSVCYEVAAVDLRGNTGPASDPACASPVGPPPAAGWRQFHRDPAKTGSTDESARLAGAPPLLQSLPLGGPAASGAVWGDVDGDGAEELVVGVDSADLTTPLRVRAFDVAGDALVPLWTVDLPRDDASHTSGFVLTPALIESGDGDGGLEVAVAYEYDNRVGTARILDANLALLDGADGRVLSRHDLVIFNARSHLTVGDPDADGFTEVAVTSPVCSCEGGSLRIYEARAGILAEQARVSFPSGVGAEGSPAFVDLDLDGIQEVLTPHVTDNALGGILITDPFGRVLHDVVLTGGIVGVAAADLDLDGFPEIVATSRTDTGGAKSLFVLDSAEGVPGYRSTFAASADAGDLLTAPSLGDLDGDGQPEIVALNTNEFLDDVTHAGDLWVFDYNGTHLLLRDRVERPGTLEAPDRESPGGAALADLDGDPGLEIVFGSLDGSLYAYSLTAGGLVQDWAIPFGSPIAAPPMLADVRPNDEVDIVVADAGGTGLALLGSTNHRPALPPLPTLGAAEGSPFAATLSASDPDGDALVLRVEGLPPGASFQDRGDGTGTLAWTPAFDTAGAHALRFVASDGRASAAASFDVLVADTDRPPSIAVPGSVAASEGSPLTFTVSAADPDGDAVSLGLSPLPTGATFVDHGDGTGSFSWTPGFDAAGTYVLQATAAARGLSQGATVTLVVANTDRPPVIQEIPGVVVREGDLLTLQVRATDADGDPISLESGPLPRGASFKDAGDGTGVLTWRPRGNQDGTYLLTLRATAGPATSAMGFKILVVDR